jgi:hypothetical protein
MDMQTALQIYGAGAVFWCALMSAQGSAVDLNYCISVVIWPIMLVHVTVRTVFGVGKRR